jgi:hypothetical protein
MLRSRQGVVSWRPWLTKAKEPMNSKSKQLLTILAGSLAGWLIVFLVVAFPIFHLAFKFPIAKIASYLSICCAVQVAISPWFIYARRTPQRPEGRVTHRLIAVTLFATTITLLFLYYIGRSRPEDPATLQSALIAMGEQSYSRSSTLS